MIDRELQERGNKRGAQGSDLGSGQPDGPARAVGGLSHAVKGRMISVREAATGNPRWRTLGNMPWPNWRRCVGPPTSLTWGANMANEKTRAPVAAKA